MPDAVRKHIPDLKHEAVVEADAIPADELDISGDMAATTSKLPGLVFDRRLSAYSIAIATSGPLLHDE